MLPLLYGNEPGAAPDRGRNEPGAARCKNAGKAGEAPDLRGGSPSDGYRSGDCIRALRHSEGIPDALGIQRHGCRQGNYDMFLSHHSNALNDGTATNYPLMLYRGNDGEGGDGAPEAPLERGVGKAPLHHPRLVVLRMGASDLAVREAQNRRQVFDPAARSGGLLHGRIVQA